LQARGQPFPVDEASLQRLQSVEGVDLLYTSFKGPFGGDLTVSADSFSLAIGRAWVRLAVASEDGKENANLVFLEGINAINSIEVKVPDQRPF